MLRFYYGGWREMGSSTWVEGRALSKKDRSYVWSLEDAFVG